MILLSDYWHTICEIKRMKPFWDYCTDCKKFKQMYFSPTKIDPKDGLLKINIHNTNRCNECQLTHVEKIRESAKYIISKVQ